MTAKSKTDTHRVAPVRKPAVKGAAKPMVKRATNKPRKATP